MPLRSAGLRTLFGGAALATAGLLVAGLPAFIVLDQIYPPDLSRVAQAGAEVLDRNGRTLVMLPAPGGVWRLKTTPADVSPAFLRLLLHTEDQHFRSHDGIYLPALLRAAAQWLQAGHVVSGGSTLTMQVARLLEPRPRTVRSKLIELFRAVQLEKRLSKDEILGIWLTLAPYGGNLEGVRAGAWAWFGQHSDTLDAAQSALLVAIPRRPEALRPDRHPSAAGRLRDRLLADAVERAEPLPTRRTTFPRHAAAALRSVVAAADGDRLRSTLDLPLQDAVERTLAERLRAAPSHVSLAVIVVDGATREVRAIASGDGSPGRGGALDLTRAFRSPGSALKPMLYGLAFQDGLVTPSTRVDDLPRFFGHYAPENFDRRFAGQVTVAEALQRSLNLPAVALLNRIGPARFEAALIAAGVRLRLPPHSTASLPLALGGVGMQLRDLARMYAALAMDGTSLPLRWRVDAVPEPARPLLQPSAARMVAGVLTRPFPDTVADGIAWKTGTSWGGRDAWAAGFDARHVVAVWFGRPDGTAVPGATGVGTALPVLAQIFGLLTPAPRDAGEERRPATLATTAVAATEGLRLLFPPPGSTLSADGPVPIRVMGGRRPVTFLVDGATLPSVPAGRTALWQPGGPGFYTLSAQDADGAMVRAEVRVQ